MSVLIKGMEMPETCDDCPFHVYHSHYEYVCKATPMFYPMNLANTKGIRKEWRPLEEVPECEDAVGRQAAIDIVRSECRCGEQMDLIEELKALPSAQPEQRWIPCSDRMPDQYGNYLISIEGDEPDIGTINPNDPRGWSLCDANGFYWASDKYLNITAWMPLPKPYREEGEEDESD